MSCKNRNEVMLVNMFFKIFSQNLSKFGLNALLSFSSISNPKYFAAGVLLILSPRIVKENLWALIFLGEKT